MDRRLREWVHDPYKSKRKLPEPSACPDCGAVYSGGRWTWGPLPPDAAAVTCPACQRIADRVPAGFLTLQGDFLAAHRDEIMGLLRNVERRERSEHPLKRMIAVRDEAGAMVVTFTDPHLARSAGEELARAYDGELDFHYQKDEYLLRVTWSR